MLILYLVLIAILSLGYLLSLKYNNTTCIYILKPTTMLTIIIFAVYNYMYNPTNYVLLIIIALIASLIGDIFLILPNDRFIPGLISFFVAHIIYIVAFINYSLQNLNLLLASIMLVLAIIFFYKLKQSIASLDLILAVGAYILVLTAMSFYAISTGVLFLMLGISFFILSDSFLAWNKFVKPFYLAKYLIIITYFAAQTLIVLSTI